MRSRINGQLHPHQTESVRWMLDRELVKGTGGILADDMGLGKTYQIAALLAANPSPRDESTLVVTLVSTVAQWEKVLREFVDMPPVRFVANSNLRVDLFDVAITTYSTFLQKKTPDAIARRKWHRIVLDEGHAIKNDKTRTHKELTNLIRVGRGQFRWVVSGTPVHNDPRELQTLLRWVGCDVGEEAQKECIMRRVLEDVDGVRLPELITRVKYLMFKYPEERALYMKLADPSSKRYARGQKAQHLDADLRMRQACIHPRLCFDGILSAAKAKAAEKTADDPSGPLCEVDPQYDKYRCTGVDMRQLEELQQQQLHDDALHDAEDSPPTVDMDDGDTIWAAEPVVSDDEDFASIADMYDPCKYSSAISNDWPSEDVRERMTKDSRWFESMCAYDFPRSTKFEYLARHLARDKRDGMKSLVFCEYKEEMALLGQYLDRVNVRYCQYDGDMSKPHRDASLINFEQQDVTVLIVQVQAGGVGLNLQMASKVYMTAPKWNPVTELQAIARVHRMKQTRPVTCVRLVMAGTIEETACMRAEEHKIKIISRCLADSSLRLCDKLGFGDMSTVYHIAKRNDMLCKLHAIDVESCLIDDE